MTSTMYHASNGMKTSQTVGTATGGSIITGLEAWGAVLCFQAGGAWAILGVVLALIAFGTFCALIGSIVDIWS